MTDVPLKCQCGAVQGNLKLKSPDEGNHVVCYCVDCQAFANHLSGCHDILDDWGGTKVYQIAPWHVEIHAGIDQLRCLRLTRKGLYRWYTECCSTPVGNTVSAKFPFIGLIHTFIDTGEQTDSLLGPVRGYHKLDSAVGKPPRDIQNVGMPVTTTFRVFYRLFKWKLTGSNKPNPFFDASGKTISKPRVLSSEPE